MTLYRYLVRLVVCKQDSDITFTRIVSTYATTDTRARCQALDFIIREYSSRSDEYTFQITSVARETLRTTYSL